MPIYRGPGWKLYLPYEAIGEVMRSEGIKHELKVKADDLEPKIVKAYEDANLADAAAATKVDEGVRPKGRPYAQVTVDDSNATAYEFGDSDVERRRILGKVANVQVNTR